MYYFAYGSNLNYSRLYGRCPNACVVGCGELDGYRLCFMENNGKRVVANIVKRKGQKVLGVLYDINTLDRVSLDRCEGHPFVYKREEVEVEYKGKMVKAFTYIMPKKCQVYNRWEIKFFMRNYGVPKSEYFNHLVIGYSMFNLNQNLLREAYEYSMKRGREVSDRRRLLDNKGV